jgi:hypothetical protein
MFSGADADTLGWIRAGIWVLAALVVIALAGRSFRTDRPAVAEPVAVT